MPGEKGLIIQAKVVKEIDGLGPDWVPAYEDLEEKLPYIDAVLHEALRLFPPAFHLWREAEEPLVFEGDSFYTWISYLEAMPAGKHLVRRKLDAH